FTQKKQPKDVTTKAKKPKTTKQEEQLDWMTADIFERFQSLSAEQQAEVLNRAEKKLKGVNKARFGAERAAGLKHLMRAYSLDINEAMMTL
ncbi:MAG: hypothetical protein KDI39_11600, partial [Pseudomonadales bacterium]|nr:hypothetical protein [Pseudomonadales bacterium]